MQPWKISAELTAALAGSAFLLGGSRLDYLAPHWSAILAEHGLALALHVVLILGGLAAAIYVTARTTGLADLGSRVDLAERSVRRGEGDAGLEDALRQDEEGEWE